MTYSICRWRLAALALVFVGWPGQGYAAPAAPEPSLATLGAQIHRIHALVESLRVEMGKPPAVSLQLKVEGASLREVYSQAWALHAKAGRLAFEQTRRLSPQPDRVNDARASDIADLLTRSESQLQAVAQRLDLTSDAPAAETPAAGPDMNQLFLDILQVNRQINGLLDERFAPSDVYQQVTMAINYGAVFLSRFPGARRIPKSPVFQRAKRPVDVYRRLLECETRIGTVLDKAGLSTMTVQSKQLDTNAVTPSDVYDLASLLVAELAYLHARGKDLTAPAVSYNVGRKLPSHVFQRAGLLLTQLNDLSARASADPDWLTRE